MQVDAFIFQGPPEAFDEDVVEVTGFAVHGDFSLGALQPVGPVEGCELRPLDALLFVKRRCGSG